MDKTDDMGDYAKECVEPKKNLADEYVMLNLAPEKGLELFNNIVRSRDMLRDSLRGPDFNICEMGFIFGWLDAYLTELSKTIPSRYLPSEKPVRPPNVSGGGPLEGPVVIAGGGGAKPD